MRIGNRGLGTGAIIGIVIGVVLAVTIPAVVAVIVFTSGGGTAGTVSINSFDQDTNINGNYQLSGVNYGLTGNTVYCTGTVHWIGASTTAVQTLISLCANRPYTGKALDVKLLVHIDFSGNDFVDYENVWLGGAETPYPQSYNFSLSFTYHD